jgi:hypothetical protein
MITINIKRNHRIVLLLIILAANTVVPATAQEGPAGLKAFLQKIQQSYQHASHLGFRIKYYYANENQPSLHLDSLQGEVQMDKGHCRFVIDEVETIVTDNYTIQIRKEDKAMYLSGTHNRSTINPVGLVDSLLAHMKGVQASVSGSGQSETMTLSFPPDGLYTQIAMTRDKQTGFLTRIMYNLHTEPLVGQEQVDRPGHPGVYQQTGRVEMLFSSYRQQAFGEALFNESNFFTKTDGRFEPAAPYQDYQIYNTSLNQ